jgi:hypothetical protein
MTTNIQTVNNVPSHQFLHYFGFHIALMKRGYDGEPCELQEGIGPFHNLYDCIEKFEKTEHVETYLKWYYKQQSDRNSLVLSNLKWSPTTLVKRIFFGFGFFHGLKTKIEKLENIKQQYVSLLSDPLVHTPIKKLDEQINVPKYLIGEQDYYFYPSIVKGRLIVRKLNCVQRIIEKASVFPPYTHSFSYDFCDVNDKNFKLHYSFLNIFEFDGAKWGYELGKDMLFLSEEDAKSQVTEFYKAQLEALT